MLQKIDYKVIIQIIAAVILLSLPLFLVIDQDISRIPTPYLLVHYLLFCLIFISIYFIHAFYLFPKLYVKSKYVSYLIYLIVILSFLIWLKPFDKFISQHKLLDKKEFLFRQPPFDRQRPPLKGSPFQNKNDRGPNSGPRIDVSSIFLFFLTIIISFTKETNKQLSQTTQRALIAEAERAHAELSFLKAQVNPHFLFNTLNNIYTLALTSDGNTAPSIMKLSNIMRYITDETGQDFVSLLQEINCIIDFVDLQKLRLTEKTTLFFEIEGDFEDKKIAPLILMAFIENVFKYGISNHVKSKLTIKISTYQNTLILFCQNPLYADKTDKERSGIGLENTRKRLNYVYKDKHNLEIDGSQKLFTATLTIQL